MKDPWLNHMRNLVEEHSETPPEGLWNDLEKTLFPAEEEETLVVPINSNVHEAARIQKTAFPWGRIAAAAILLLSMGGGYWFWTNQNENSMQPTASNHGTSGGKEVNSPIDSSSSSNSENQNLENPIDGASRNQPKVAVNSTTRNQPSQQINREFVHVDIISNEKLSNANPIAVNSTLKSNAEKGTKYQINSNQTHSSTKPNDKQIAVQTPTKNESNSTQNNPVPTTKSEAEKPLEEDLEQKALIAKLEKEIEAMKTKKEVSKDHWIAGVQTSGLSLSSNEALSGYYSMGRNQMSLAPIVMGNATYWQSPYMDVFVRNQGKEVETEIKHRNPISVGATVQYQISNKVGISSGVQYTKLVSDLKAGTDENYIKSEQVIQYIGVPISFNYSFLNKEKWNSYVSLGGQIDQPIDGVIKTKYVNGVASTNNENQKLSGLKMQFSTSAGVGAQYNFTPRLGIYAEPLMVYYIDNGSQIGSVYKEKPLNFHLRMGLRWNLTK